MDIITCKVPWCERERRALGYCFAHYKRHRKGQDMDAPFKGAPQKCKALSCHREALAKGYCNAHYIRLANGSDMLAAIRKRSATGVCDVPGCGRKHMGHGLCANHYRQEMRRRFWRALLAERGDRCSKCKRRYPIAVYDLHHRDPSTKEFAVSNQIGNRSLDELLAEARKCDLLCANCHRALHAGGWSNDLFAS